jgi:L-ribulose-5-phosphate 4-epimerase
MSEAIAQASLGIELGSTRIKACLVAPDGTTLATGGFTWENRLVDGLWTYSLEEVRAGVRAAYGELAANVEREHGARPASFAAIGVSAMMHGYLAFDASGELLVPFRTWRNTNTATASAELSEAFGFAIPLRWSAAHLYQAVLDGEQHVPRVHAITTLAGHVHELLTGRHVLGVGDASGVFPIDTATGSYDARMLGVFDELAASRGATGLRIASALPEVLSAGEDAGELTAEGAALLDAAGVLRPGVPVCPPEGDAGTGMVATGAVAPRTGNVSAGTSIFAMVVLEEALRTPHEEIDIVTTPAGDPVAMVHCNNGASELNAWADVFGEFAQALGHPSRPDAVFEALLGAALDAGADEGMLVYNFLSGEPIAGLQEGRPLFVRTPGSRLTLAGFARAQLQGAFATLSLGMRTLTDEGVTIEEMRAHGGMFRTRGVAQRILAAALGAPVSVADTAAEGGAWGIAVLGLFRKARLDGTAAGRDLSAWLDQEMFTGASARTVVPEAAEVAAFESYLQRWSEGLAVEAAAVAAVPVTNADAREQGADMTDFSPEVQASIDRVRADVARLHGELTRYGLVVWTGGNVSGRVPGSDLFVIKPSGVSYDDLTPENMILCDLDGDAIPGTPGAERSPSSDTAAHAYVYRNMPEVGGVVHTHSTYAVAWAARAEPIPCAITGMADEFGGEIPVGPFAIIGDDSIGRGIVETLRGHRSRAVLMQNHGPFTIGKDARDAVKAAVMVEDAARTIHIARQLGEPVAIPQDRIDALYDRYQNVYGQKPQGGMNR